MSGKKIPYNDNSKEDKRSGENKSDPDFYSFFNPEDIRKMHESFSGAAGVSSVFIGPGGENLVEPTDPGRLAGVLQNPPKEAKNVEVQKASPVNIKELLIREAGLWESKSGIFADDKMIAEWILGGVFLKEEFDKDILPLIAGRLGTDSKKVLKALKSTPVLSGKLLEKISEAQSAIAKMLSNFAEQKDRANNYFLELTNALEKREESEKLYNLLINASPDGITIADRFGKIIYISEKTLELFGYDTENEMIGRNMLEFVHPDDMDKAVMNISSLGRGINPESSRYRFLKKDGTFFWGEVNSRVLQDHQKKVKGFFSITRDISASKIDADRIRKNEWLYRQLFETMLDGLAFHEIVCDTKGRPMDYVFLEVNRAFETITGLKAKEIIGKKVTQVLPEVESYWINTYGKVALSRETMKFENYSHELDKYFEVVAYSPERGKFATIVRDVTERKHYENILKESEERFRQIIMLSPLAMAVINKNGTIDFVNDQFFNLTGFKKEEIPNTETWMYLAYPDTDYRESVNSEWFDTIKEVSGHNTQIKDREYIITCKNGKRKNIQFKLASIADKFILVLNDITQIRTAEKERENLIAGLEKKNAEMERFTYTVSHDLRSPLVTIKGFLGLLDEDIADGITSTAADYIERISVAADKMQSLLEDLLELSRIGTVTHNPAVLDMNLLIKEVLELLHGSITGKKAEIITENNYPAIFGDKKRIGEVFQNLIENSLKFSRKNVIPKIKIGFQKDDYSVTFTISDNGIGIDRQYIEKIFGLFDKLDPESEGTGVGLALVKRIVETHNGSIRIESEGENKGMVVYVKLPAAENITEEK